MIDYRERERIYISIALALIIHLLFAFLLSMVDWRAAPKKKNIGPMYVELSPLPGSALMDKQGEHPLDSSREEPIDIEEPLKKDRLKESDLDREAVTPLKPETSSQQAEAIAQPKSTEGLRSESSSKDESALGEVLPQEVQESTYKRGETEPTDSTSMQKERVEETAKPIQEEEAHSPWADLAALDEALASGGETTPTGTAEEASPDALPQTRISDSSGIQWDNPTLGRELIKGGAIQLPSGFTEQISFEVEFILTAAGVIKDLKIYPNTISVEVQSAIFEQLMEWQFESSPGAPDVIGRIPIDTITKR